MSRVDGGSEERKRCTVKYCSKRGLRGGREAGRGGAVGLLHEHSG